MAYRKWDVTEHEGRIYVLEVNPKKRRGFGERHRFQDREKAEAYAAGRRSQDEAREAVKAERRKTRARARAAVRNPWKVGDLFVNSWGYEQTNIDFYEVAAMTQKTVTLRRIASETVPGNDAFMSRDVRPVPGGFLENEKPVTKTVQAYVNPDGTPGEAYLSAEFGSFSRVQPGETRHETSYA